jgi:hypothetical protein
VRSQCIPVTFFARTAFRCTHSFFPSALATTYVRTWAFGQELLFMLAQSFIPFFSSTTLDKLQSFLDGYSINKTIRHSHFRASSNVSLIRSSYWCTTRLHSLALVLTSTAFSCRHKRHSFHSPDRDLGLPVHWVRNQPFAFMPHKCLGPTLVCKIASPDFLTSTCPQTPRAHVSTQSTAFRHLCLAPLGKTIL